MERINPEKQLGKQLFYGFRKAFIKNNRISIGARFLLILLMTYLGKNKSCWASQGRLAKDMGCDVDTLRKYLRILQSEGHLIVQSRGIGRSLLYTPSYLKVSAGGSVNKYVEQEPTELTEQRPTEISSDRSIVSGNKDKGFLKGKELFEKRRRELGLISNKTRVGDGV